jgi:sialate O-acetylesterase
MVMQQHQKIPVWGKGESGGEVTVSFNGETRKAIVDETGRWRVELSPVDAGGPYTLEIRGEETFAIRNVLVGEVWICSGQSNMEMALGGWGKTDNFKEEVANARYPNMRLLIVDKVMSTHSYDNFESDGWKICSPETVREFSAVAWFFGRHLSHELKVPIGLIETAWGGTPVETWMSSQAFNRLYGFSDILNAIKKGISKAEIAAIAAEKKLNEWPDKIEKALIDKGTTGHGFQNRDYNTDEWQTMKLPTVWENAGLSMDGLVWFTRDIEIPESWKGEDLILNLGKINDFDVTWFNGKRIGRGTDVSEFRGYRIPASLVENGKNRIAVEVLDFGNSGGLYGPAKKMNLASGQGSISLVGNWKYIVDPVQVDLKNLPKKANNNSEAFNGMINPLLPYGIRGAIWYQGEANVERACQYSAFFKLLIKDWRSLWGQGDFPFLFVQLPNFMEEKPLPADDAWAELREAQATALDLPNTGMAVTIDIGEANDIHPKNKQDVGRRLALNALATVYKKEIPYSGPLYKSMRIERDKVRIQFSHTFGGLKIKEGNSLKGFAIAGEDKKFVWASAKIDGDEVLAWDSKISKPVAVRYAWASNPVSNLTNQTDLPASPFRTDQWEGITCVKR